MIQESHSCKATEDKWRKDWNGEIYFSHGTPNSCGVITLIPSNLGCTISEVYNDAEGRLLILLINSEYGQLLLANIYAPTKDNPAKQSRFLQKLSDAIHKYEDYGIIIGGDFNICQNEFYDKQGGKQQTTSNSAKQLDNMMTDINLIDVWRILNPELRQFTRRQNSKIGLIQSRLDFWLISTYLLYDVNNVKIKPGLKSDHSIVSLTFNFHTNDKRGRGFFKFNNSLLHDKEYVVLIKNTIKECNTETKLDDKGLLWDYLKCKIRGITISYSVAKAKQNRILESELLHKIRDLETNLSTDNLDEYNTYKKELEMIYTHKGKGAMLRSKAKVIEEDEKPTRYFLRQENQNHKNKHIRSLLVNDDIVNDPQEILNAEKEFYENLYTQNTVNNEKYDQLFSDIPILSEEEKVLCDRPICIDEVSNSLKSLSNNKTPGSDGLTTNFYKFFWTDIKHYVFDSFRYAFETKSLSIEQKRGILNIIPKKGKDLRYLKNWRPISLLNTDYKILTKLLANRLQKVISSIVSSDQNGYIKKRFIGENIRTIVDVMDYCKQFEKPGILLQLDFEKAFDSVSWQFLDKTIAAFNFGEQFKRWIKLLYSDSECCVTNNGHHSEFFKLSCGIRQGCPISALLFILVVEIMSNSIRKNSKILGIKLGNKEVKISQLADDTTLFLNDLTSVSNLFDFLDYFGKCSGLKLNKSKTEAIWLGSNIGQNETPLNLKWNEGFFKCLGIWFHTNTHLMIKKNYQERLTNLQKLLQHWQQRMLSLKGKITVLWSIALPQLLYVTSVLHTPLWVIEEADKLMFKFLWSNKKPHVKRTTIISNIPEGGLKMVHFDSMVKAIKLNWIKRFLNSQSTCNQIIDNIIGFPVGMADLLKCHMDEKIIKRIKSNFYHQILSYWLSIKHNQPLQANDIYNQSIWFNTFLTVDNKPMFNRKWWEKGISFIYDVVDNNARLLSKNEIENKFHMTVDQMEYNSLIASIPAIWLKDLRKHEKNIEKCGLTVLISNKRVPIEKIKCSDYYNQFISKISAPPTAVAKWNELYIIEELNWQSFFQIPFTCCDDTKLQTFQYRIIHRFFPSSYNLFLWKLEESSICKHCEENESDTLEHYFYQCPTVFRFWKTFSNWWKRIYGFLFLLREMDIVFGVLNDNNDTCVDVMNYCILIGKYYISKAKNVDETVSFLNYLHILKNKMEVMKTRYCLKGKEDVFEEKWSTLYNNF